MIAALKLAASDLRTRGSLLAGAVLLVAAPMAGLLLLHGFTRHVEVDFAAQETDDLIVQESNSVGEVTGSRIPAHVEQELLDLGVTFAIPEIHAVAGSSAGNAVLIRGVDALRFEAVTSFRLVSGRVLREGDDAAAVMLGVDLAADRGVEVGDDVALRSRAHRVVGIFEVGTYADNEAWLSLAGAQSLLGWGNEVSVFVIPDDGTLAEGDFLEGPLSVARRGDFVELIDEWDPIFLLANVANLALAAAAAIILTVILWRLAWLRRRELAILRTIGMGRGVVAAYLFLEGAAVALLGLAGGIAGSYLLGGLVRIEAMGFSATAVLDETGIVRGTLITAAILAFAVTTATSRVVRNHPAELLRGE